MQSRMSDDFESWLRASDNVVKIPDPSPEMDEKVFLAAYPTLRCPLITMPIEGGQAAGAGGVDGSASSSSDFADFAARAFLRDSLPPFADLTVVHSAQASLASAIRRKSRPHSGCSGGTFALSRRSSPRLCVTSSATEPATRFTTPR